MRRSRLIKLPQHKQFNYTPRHYSENKENIEDRLEKIKTELSIESNQTETESNYTPSIKGQFRSAYTKSEKTRTISSVRTIIIIAILLAVVFYLIYS